MLSCGCCVKFRLSVLSSLVECRRAGAPHNVRGPWFCMQCERPWPGRIFPAGPARFPPVYRFACLQSGSYVQSIVRS